MGEPVFHENIPRQLRNDSFRFIRVRPRSKRPIDTDYFDTNNFGASDQELTTHLSRNINYGVIPVKNDVCIFDVDDVEKCEQLEMLDIFAERFKTFTVKTGSGGLHVYFRCKGLLAEMETPKRIPLYDLSDESCHLGEVYPAGCRAYVVGPGSIHPTGNSYEIMKNAPIVEIPFDVIYTGVFAKSKHTLWAARQEDATQFEKRIPSGRYSNLLSEEIGLRIEDIGAPVNGVHRGTEIQGAHPVHGSSTGHNYSIDTRRNLWHCFRCDSGGDPITFVAVQKGLISCSDAGRIPITDEIFLQVKESLATEYGYGTQIEEIDRKWRKLEQKRLSESVPREISTGDPFDNRAKRGLRFKSYLPDDNLIERYVSVAKKMTDAYPELHYAGIYSLVSMVANRNAVVKFSHGNIYSNIWSMCLGISTISRKSTALKIARDIARYHAPTAELPGSFSPEALIEELTDNPRAWWFKDEVGSLLSTMQQKQYMAEMRDFLNEIYENQNYRRKLRTNRSKNRSEFVIDRPYTTFFFATTPETFSEQTTALDLTSGWLLRFLYFFPRYYKVSQPYQEANEETQEEMEYLRSLIGELFTFFRLTGEELQFVLTPEGMEFFQSWQRDVEMNYFRDGDNVRLAQYGRLFTYALKLAMLFKIGDPKFVEMMAAQQETGIQPGQQVILDECFLIEACRQIDQYFSPMAADVADTVARRTEINVQEKILSLLRRNGGEMKRVDILRALHIKLKDFEEHALALVESNEIKVIEYHRPGKKKDIRIYLENK